jgi:hypothetical protein
VLGDGSELSSVARLAGLDPDEAGVLADELARVDILSTGRPLSFVHPLVRTSVDSEIARAERSRLHAQAAEQLRESGAPTDRIATHLLVCEPRGDPGRVAVLRDAATAARRRGAVDVSATFLRRALAEASGSELGPRIAIELGSTELEAGNVQQAVEDVSTVLRSDVDPLQRAQAAGVLAAALAFTDRPAVAVGAITDALTELPATQRELGIRLQAMRRSRSSTWKHGEICVMRLVRSRRMRMR